MKNSSYDFPVVLLPIYLEPTGKGAHALIPKRQAVVRADSNEVLAIVSDQYALLPHKEVVDGFRKALGGFVFEEKIELAKNGGRLFYKATIPSVKVEIAPDDFCSLVIIAQNSYDSTHTLTISFGAFRLVCSNGLMVGQRFLNLSQKHSGKKLEVNVDEIGNQIQKMTNEFNQIAPVMKRMTQISATTDSLDDFRDLFDPKQVELPEYILKEAKLEFLRSDSETLWSYYNALTFAITHKMKHESPALSLQYGKVAWERALLISKDHA